MCSENLYDILLDDSCDPDVNFFIVKFENLYMPYLCPVKFKIFLIKVHFPTIFQSHPWISRVLRIKKSFENFRLFLKSFNFNFSVIWFSETWLDKLGITRDFLYEHPSNNQIRSDRKGAGDSVYIHETFDFKHSPNLSVNIKDIEAIGDHI